MPRLRIRKVARTEAREALDWYLARSPRAAVPAAVADLYREVRAVLDEARTSAYRAVNTAMVQSYWQVGRLIV